MLRRLVLLLAVSTAVPAAAQMLANQGPPQHRLVQKHTFALRYNPLGLLYTGNLTYRYRLYETPSTALRDNFIGGGVTATASPAFLRVGPILELNPLTVFGLWASVQLVQYFGTTCTRASRRPTRTSRTRRCGGRPARRRAAGS